jgi:DNA-binding NarL/FixJ family response regulator
MERTRILISHRDPVTLSGLRAVLAENNFIVCAEAATVKDAKQKACRDSPDICLLDVHMTGGGIRAAVSILDARPNIPVVMFAASSSDSDLFAALRAGASGYLLEDDDQARLPRALRGVLGGTAALSPILVARVLREFRTPHSTSLASVAGPLVDFTRREQEVLHLMRQGASTADMASHLFVSPATVRSHISAIVRKLRAEDRESAVRLLERLA